MNEPQLPIGPVRPQLVRSTSWMGFLATTIALMLLASGGTAYLVNLGTGPGAVPKGLQLSIDGGQPTPLTSQAAVVVPRAVGALNRVRHESVVAAARVQRAESTSILPSVAVPAVKVPPAPPAPPAAAPIVLPPPEALPVPTKPNGKPIKNLVNGAGKTVKGLTDKLLPQG